MNFDNFKTIKITCSAPLQTLRLAFFSIMLLLDTASAA